VNVCIPVIEDQGLKSRVNPHFGSAPMFVVVETESGSCRAIPNGNQHHEHGGCQPLRALAGESIDSVIVGGIGMGAVEKLRAAGIRVFMSRLETVEETLAAFKDGSLAEATPATACAHHGHGPHAHGHSGSGGEERCHGRTRP
jgi:predicted Fe-Mo cluster-binding NifX family protein